MQIINIFRRNSELKYLIPSLLLLASAAIYHKSGRTVSMGITDQVPHRLSSMMIALDIAAVIYIAFRIWRPRQTNTRKLNYEDDYREIIRMRKIYIIIMTTCPFMTIASFIGSNTVRYIVMTVFPVIIIISTCVFVKYFEDTIVDEDGEEVLELPDITYWVILGISSLIIIHSGIILDRWSFPLFLTVIGIVTYIFINNRSAIEKTDVSWMFFAALFVVMGIIFTIGINYLTVTGERNVTLTVTDMEETHGRGSSYTLYVTNEDENYYDEALDVDWETYSQFSIGDNVDVTEKLSAFNARLMSLNNNEIDEKSDPFKDIALILLSIVIGLIVSASIFTGLDMLLFFIAATVGFAALAIFSFVQGESWWVWGGFGVFTALGIWALIDCFI